MPADYSRVHRILAMIGLFQQRGWGAKQLAEHFNTTQRTIYRDLDVLQQLGIPCWLDKDTGGYRISHIYFMKPVELTFEELLAMVSLGELIARDEQIPATAPAMRAMAKLRAQLPATLRNDLAKLEDRMHIKLARAMAPEAVKDVYHTMRLALAECNTLICKYESAHGKSTSDSPEFEFEPYALKFDHRAWYVYGYHHRHQQVRCMKLNRFTALQTTDKHYRIPADFSLDDQIGLAWRMIPGSDRHDVELIFDAAFAETIADTCWHSTQQINWLDDGAIRFTCTVDGLDEIVWWILGMGPHCRIVKPQCLTDRVQTLARQMVELYEN